MTTGIIVTKLSVWTHHNAPFATAGIVDVARTNSTSSPYDSHVDFSGTVMYGRWKKENYPLVMSKRQTWQKLSSFQLSLGAWEQLDGWWGNWPIGAEKLVHSMCSVMLKKTVTWSRLRTRKVMGGHLTPQSCRVHRALFPRHLPYNWGKSTEKPQSV